MEFVDAGASGITITEDNFVPATATGFPGGYTAEIHITSGSAVWPANFIHFPTSGAGKITFKSYADPLGYASGITSGPDLAPWFANTYASGSKDPNGSIGRITTAGVQTEMAPAGIYRPLDIVSGPDHALWFTNQNDSIGRITTTGAAKFFTSSTISLPWGIAVGSGRRAVVCERG